jgi:hypothetical protein
MPQNINGTKQMISYYNGTKMNQWINPAGVGFGAG